MSLFFQLKNLDETDKAKAVEKLITDSTPDFDYYLLITLSLLMASFGLLINSAAIVIGSMLIAPLLSPILSLSLGIVISDGKLLSRSFSTILKSTFLGVGAAIIATLFFGLGEESLTAEILARTDPSLLYFLVALIAGFAVAYTMVRPELNVTLPGIAVAVALIPPLAVIGIGIAKLDWFVVSNSLVLFLLNVVGIIFASMFVFSLMDLHGKKKVAQKTIKKEEKRLEEEKEEEEEFKEEQISS